MEKRYAEAVPYLLHWFSYHARILPWRENPQPYTVWVSEIMLQQTRVEAVKRYYTRFLEALPTITALANAPEEQLLKLWEGLGYYSRVRNMQKAAQVMVAQYGGEFPRTYEEVLALPGIGSYTAGAVCSIAYGLPVPAVDGNVLRVMKRIAGSFDDITKPRVKQALEAELTQIIPEDNAGAFNQALMELGATICLPNGAPLCAQCPVMHLCRAFHDGLLREIPVKTPKKPRRIEEKTVFVLVCGDQLALHRRAESGLLAGLMELPNIPRRLGSMEAEQWLAGQLAGDGNELRAEPVEGLAEKQTRCAEPEEDFARKQLRCAEPAEDFAGKQPRCAERFTLSPLGAAKHIFTHIEWHMTGYLVKLSEQLPVLKEQEELPLIWQSAARIRAEISIPSAFSAYTRVIDGIAERAAKNSGEQEWH